MLEVLLSVVLLLVGTNNHITKKMKLSNLTFGKSFPLIQSVAEPLRSEKFSLQSAGLDLQSSQRGIKKEIPDNHLEISEEVQVTPVLSVFISRLDSVYPTLMPTIQENSTEDYGSGEINEEFQNNKHPDTNKVDAYNTESEKPVGQVASVAIDKAKPLIPCTENSDPCITPTPPTSEPEKPFALSPTPSPKPTIIIEPPPPLENDPCSCPTRKLCPMIACIARDEVN